MSEPDYDVKVPVHVVFNQLSYRIERLEEMMKIVCQTLKEIAAVLTDLNRPSIEP